MQFVNLIVLEHWDSVSKDNKNYKMLHSQNYQGFRVNMGLTILIILKPSSHSYLSSQLSLRYHDFIFVPVEDHMKVEKALNWSQFKRKKKWY